MIMSLSFKRAALIELNILQLFVKPRGLFPNLGRTYSEERDALRTVFCHPQTENERVREGGGRSTLSRFLVWGRD